MSLKEPAVADDESKEPIALGKSKTPKAKAAAQNTHPTTQEQKVTDPADLEREFQDALDSLLRRAMAAGVRPEKLLAKASVQRGVGIVERWTDAFFDSLGGEKKR